jgi:hypothetical protein
MAKVGLPWSFRDTQHRSPAVVARVLVATLVGAVACLLAFWWYGGGPYAMYICGLFAFLPVLGWLMVLWPQWFLADEYGLHTRWLFALSKTYLWQEMVGIGYSVRTLNTPPSLAGRGKTIVETMLVLQTLTGPRTLSVSRVGFADTPEIDDLRRMVEAVLTLRASKRGQVSFNLPTSGIGI